MSAPTQQPTPTPVPEAAKPRTPRAPGPTKAHSLRRHFLHSSAPPKSFDHTGYADEATLATGALVHLAHLPWPTVAGASAAAVIGAGFWAHQRFGRRRITEFAMGTAAASGAWVTWAAYDTPWSWGSMGALLAGTALLGPVYAACRWKTDKRNAKEMAERAAKRAETKRHDFEQILADAGCPDLTVNTDLNDDGWVNGERKFPNGFALALNHGKKAPDVAGLAARVPEIEKIASGSTPYPIRPGSIQVKPNPVAAHQSELIVPTSDVLAKTIELPHRAGPRSIHDPIEVAVSVDGTNLGWDVHENPHGMVAGRTTGGKTTFLNAHAYETTRSTDCVTWMICGEKPVRAFAPWLQPFLQGKADRPVIDWWAADVYEGWMMLMDSIAVVRRRQESAAITGDDKWHATPENPEIVIFIDESPDLLDSTERFPLDDCPDPDNYKGPTATFAQLLLKLIRLGRSEGLHVVFLAQRGTVSMLGAEGGDMKSQVSYRAGFQAAGTIDANAVFNSQTAGINVESLPVGALYMEFAGYSRPVLAKGLYLTQDRIRETAVEHAQYCGPIDEWTAESLTYYPERWTRQGQQDFLHLLCRNPVRTVPGQPAATTVGEGVTGRDETPETDPRQSEIDNLEALYAADPAVEPVQPVRRIDPTLPEDTRVLLEAIAASDLLYGDGPYVPTTDLLELAGTLGWPTNATAGGRRISKALAAVTVYRAEPRPRINGQKREAYRLVELRAAVEKNSKM
jgi:hypothetical protein